MAKPQTHSLSELRQALRKKLAQIERLLAPGFEREPTFPALVNSWLHTCGRDGCRCQRGEKHRSVRLSIRFRDGTAERSLSEDQVDVWRERTDAYRRIRTAMRQVRPWAKEVVALLDEIERARRLSTGLSEEDQKRPLR